MDPSAVNKERLLWLGKEKELLRYCLRIPAPFRMILSGPSESGKVCL